MSRNNPPGPRASVVCQIRMSENVYSDIQEVRTEKALMGKIPDASNITYLP